MNAGCCAFFRKCGHEGESNTEYFFSWCVCLTHWIILFYCSLE